MIKGKDLEELKVPKVAEIRAKLYEALGKSYAAGKKDSDLKPIVAKLRYLLIHLKSWSR